MRARYSSNFRQAVKTHALFPHYTITGPARVGEIRRIPPGGYVFRRR